MNRDPNKHAAYGWSYPPGCTQAHHDKAWGDEDERGSREEWDIREAELKIEEALERRDR